MTTKHPLIDPVVLAVYGVVAVVVIATWPAVPVLIWAFVEVVLGHAGGFIEE